MINEGNLLKLASFAIKPGAATIIRIPTLNGPVVQPGRPAPDTFHMQLDQGVPQVGDFRVVDENARFYRCVGDSARVIGGRYTIEGFIMENGEIVNEREAVIAAIKVAKEAQKP